ncbi:uncharacterized protein EI97DRAFT_233189 [Westerdykella ornata]|uniref:RING-type domain-containing protein n=1 Tax=Westerdykella ornata TaxID=318751 RepID=A0A6A6J7M7_WESOR|nr:uncharacterized protein EI97DRAFT_233189 [Westerdykella ornata]KAF2272173.1 hypothetical protein EI97DRAFT_233189 [Westerdykella ornata]
MPALPGSNGPSAHAHRLLTRQESESVPVPSGNQQVVFTPAIIGVIVTVFTLILFGPLVCIRIRRRRLARRTPAAAPRIIQQLRTLDRESARTTLEGVAKVLSVEELKALKDGKGTESDSESASVLERECAICLASLFSLTPPPRTLTRQITQTFSFSAPARTATMSEPSPILRLQTCRHEFHEECLLSWFLMRKYSCPVCRAVYYVDPVEKRRASASLSPSERVSDRSSSADWEGNNGESEQQRPRADEEARREGVRGEV